jgi:hypothetical protein
VTSRRLVTRNAPRGRRALFPAQVVFALQQIVLLAGVGNDEREVRRERNGRDRFALEVEIHEVIGAPEDRRRLIEQPDFTPTNSFSAR